MRLKIGRLNLAGISFERMPDANGLPWLTSVAWYPRSLKLLGYLYGSLPLNLAALRAWVGYRFVRED